MVNSNVLNVPLDEFRCTGIHRGCRCSNTLVYQSVLLCSTCGDLFLSGAKVRLYTGQKICKRY